MLSSYFIELWESFHQSKEQLCNLLNVSNVMDGIYRSFACQLAFDYYGRTLSHIWRLDQSDIKLDDGRKLLVFGREESSYSIDTDFEIKIWNFDLLVVCIFNKKGELMKALEFDAATVKEIIEEEKKKWPNNKYVGDTLTFTKGYYGEYDDKLEKKGKCIIRELQHSIDIAKQNGCLQPAKAEAENEEMSSIVSYSIDEEALQCKFICFDGSRSSLGKLIDFLSQACCDGLECNFEIKEEKLFVNGKEVKEGDYFVKDDIETFLHYPLKRLFLEDFIEIEAGVCIPAYVYEDMLYQYCEYDGTKSSCENIMWAIESYEGYNGYDNDYDEDYDDESSDDEDYYDEDDGNKKSGYTIKNGKMYVETSEYGTLVLEIGDGVSFNSYSYEFMPCGTPVYVVGGRELNRVYKIEIAKQQKTTKQSDIIEEQDDSKSKTEVTIKGMRIDIYKSTNESFQHFVKRTFSKLIENKLLSDSVMKQLFDKQFCKETFGIEYALLQTDWKNCLDGAGHDRYWKTFKIANAYFCCSEWWKEKFPLYEEKLAKWLKTLKDK